MKPTTIALALLGLFTLGSACTSDAEQAASTFRSASEALGSSEPSADPRVQLARCDAQLTRCERDEVGVNFLGAAYLALWIILVAFFFIVRARQRRLVLEMAELKARLARLQDRPPSP